MARYQWKQNTAFLLAYTLTDSSGLGCGALRMNGLPPSEVTASAATFSWQFSMGGILDPKDRINGPVPVTLSHNTVTLLNDTFGWDFLFCRWKRSTTTVMSFDVSILLTSRADVDCPYELEPEVFSFLICYGWYIIAASRFFT
jgi:hypothetical protein